MKITPGHGWISLWRHFFDREQTVSELTDSMIRWQERWQWDFLKINPPACYHALDWGAEYEFFPDPFLEPRLTKAVVHSAEDARNIAVPAVAPVLAGQLQVIRNLRSHFGASLPLVHTVFSPIEIAHRLMSGRPALIDMMRHSAADLHALLQKITHVYGMFCEQCIQSGANGIFFATKWASSGHMSWQEYEEFGRRYELMILNRPALQDSWMILHVCGENTYLDHMLDYPVDVFSYDFFAAGAPGPASVAEQSGKWVLGGIDPERLEKETDAVLQQAQKFSAIERWMAGPSCVVPPAVSDAAIARLKKHLAT